MIDIYQDILHIYFSNYYRLLPAEELEKVAPKNLLKRLKLMIRLIQKRWVSLMQRRDGNQLERLEGKFWLFAISLNNKRSLDFIYDKFTDCTFVLDKPRDGFLDVRVEVLILQRQFFYLILFPWIYLNLWWRCGRFTHRMAPVILKSCGYYQEWIRVLKNTRPRAIAFANDHNVESRSLLMAANAVGVKTLYVQHATVSESFPPLRFGLSLLEGRDALEKYQAAGEIVGRVELVGMPRFDKYASYRKKRSVIRNIGIPYNPNDDQREIVRLIKEIQSSLPAVHLTLRRHPKDRKEINWATHCAGISHSDPYAEDIFQFLLRQDLIIGGNSSIHLEATLLNIPSLYNNMSAGEFIDDYYGYVKNKLVSRVEAASQLPMQILALEKSNEDVYTRAVYYNSVVGTADEGSSSALALKSIQEFLKMDEPISEN